jgi:hypothetical protein
VAQLLLQLPLPPVLRKPQQPIPAPVQRTDKLALYGASLFFYEMEN